MTTTEDPRQVGQTWLSAYQQMTYTVLELLPDGFLTVEWADGRVTTHCTPLAPRDRLVSE